MADGPQSGVIAFLENPATHGGAPVRRIDTHGAVVFLAGDRAYELKRAVRFDYMDFSTVERRRAACAAELKLNRRSAPDIYLDIVAITESGTGLALGGDGPVRDWVVVMRRFDDALLFDRMARDGRLTGEMMRDLAAAIRRLHDSSAVHRRADATAHVAGLVAMALAELRRFVPRVFPAAATDALESAMQARLREDAALIVRRNGAGHVRRLHGDLHLRNIFLDDGKPVLFDALEFNEDLAIGDRLYDVAFVLMDLLQRDLGRLANTLLNAWLTEADDDAGLQLLPLFMALRAAIRAHVGATAAEGSGDEAQGKQEADARRYLDLARRLLARCPAQMIAVGGYSGTGKSTVARGLAPALGRAPGAVVLRSDEIRKALFGVPSTQRLPPEAYRGDVSQRVYETLYRRAASLLRAGHSVIADALFSRPADRLAIETIARQCGVPFRGFWLAAPYEVLAARIAARRNDASDATVDVLKRQMETPPGAMDWYTLDATLRPDDVLKSAQAVSS